MRKLLLVVCAFVTAAIAYLAIHSTIVPLDADVKIGANRWLAVEARGGVALVIVGRFEGYFDGAKHVFRYALLDYPLSRLVPRSTSNQGHGQGQSEADYVTKPYRYDIRIVTCPLWMIMVLCAAYPIFVVVRHRWRHNRRCKRGQCLNCGYDLTGNTTGACSECGAPCRMDSLEQRRSRRRSIVRDACVIVCFISVCAMLSLFNSYGRMTTVTEVCTESGAIREYEEYSLRGFVVARRHERVRTTGVSEFLLRHRVPGEHRWVFAESRQTDLSGRNVLEKAVGRDSFRLFAAYELKLTRESLGALYTHVPDLPEMIYRDILNEPNDGMAFGRVNALRQMCEHPDGLTRRLALHAWNVVLQADSAQTGAGPRNEETD